MRQDRTAATARELEIQRSAFDTHELIAERVRSDTAKLESLSELSYYLKQLTNRIEIMAHIRFGLDD